MQEAWLEKPLDELLALLEKVPRWSSRARQASALLGFSKLKSFHHPTNDPLHLASRKNDFFHANFYSCFKVWWGGKWWEQEAHDGAFSADGSMFASRKNDWIAVWKRGDTEPLWTKQMQARRPEMIRLRFSPRDDRLIAEVQSQVLHAFDSLTGRPLGTADSRRPPADLLGEAEVRLLGGHSRLLCTADGVWSQEGEKLWLHQAGKAPQLFLMDQWEPSPCQMFQAYLQEGLVVRDWGVWSLRTGCRVLAPRPALQSQRLTPTAWDSWCSLDTERSRLLLNHPYHPLEVYRLVDRTCPAALSNEALECRRSAAYRDEERELWSLILDVKGAAEC